MYSIIKRPPSRPVLLSPHNFHNEYYLLRSELGLSLSAIDVGDLELKSASSLLSIYHCNNGKDFVITSCNISTYRVDNMIKLGATKSFDDGTFLTGHEH